MQAARKAEHEGHDVSADVVVEDLAQIGHHDRMLDQRRIVESSGRRDLRRLEPTQALCLRQYLRRNGAKGCVRLGNIALGVVDGFGLQHPNAYVLLGNAHRPATPHRGVRRHHYQSERDVFHRYDLAKE